VQEPDIDTRSMTEAVLLKVSFAIKNASGSQVDPSLVMAYSTLLSQHYTLLNCGAYDREEAKRSAKVQV
jgi:hypothetical protein